MFTVAITLLQLFEANIEMQTTDFAGVLAQTQVEELRQSEEVLDRVTVYFLSVSEIVKTNFTRNGTNQTIPQMV